MNQQQSELIQNLLNSNNKPINLNAFRIQLGLLHPSSPISSVTYEPVIGIDYIPPLNAESRIIIPTLNDAEKKLQMARMNLVDTGSQIPSSYSWLSVNDIFKYHNIEFRQSPVHPPTNQYSCGCCYIMSVAAMFGDRWAIASKTVVPPFSPTFLLSCIPGISILPVLNIFT
jgi:hypothetical protein